MRKLILNRIEEMRRDTGGFRKGTMRWDSFDTRSTTRHISDMTNQELDALDDEALLMFFERLSKKYFAQM